jgi:hypothetical protein
MLADASEPLVLADGTKIDPVSRKVIKDKKSQWVEVPAATEAQRLVTRTRRSLIDMPLPVAQMNVVTVVLSYTLYGLSDAEIAIAAKLSLDQVKNIRTLEAYAAMEQSITKALLETEANDVRNFFQQQAMNAARKVVTIAEEEDGALGLAAAKDVLDRAGHRPADVVEHSVRMENSLLIEIIRRDKTDDIPVLDITNMKVDDDGNCS